MRKNVQMFFIFLIAMSIVIPIIDKFEDEKMLAICASIIMISVGILLLLPSKKSDKKLKAEQKQKKANKNNRKSDKKENENEFVCEGITRGQLNKIVRDGKAQVKQIEDIGLKIMNHKVRVDIIDICSIANDIFNDFLQDPKDVKEARRFINYYLDTTEKIVRKYYKLGNANYLSNDAKATLKDVEQTLGLIKETFRTQLKRLLDNDILDLDAEIKVLKNTIKSEGI